MAKCDLGGLQRADDIIELQWQQGAVRRRWLVGYSQSHGAIARPPAAAAAVYRSSCDAELMALALQQTDGRVHGEREMQLSLVLATQ